MTRDNVIDWIDVETNGIDAGEHKLLQVSCLVSDLELNLLDEEGYTAEILYSEGEMDWIKSNSIPYVINMHETTGLWDKLLSGTPLTEVDKQLNEYISQFSDSQKGYLGGNSITLDRNFINKNLPISGSFLSYRSIDVTTIAILAEAWYNGLNYEKQYLHDAKTDIRESLEQLKFLRKTAFK